MSRINGLSYNRPCPPLDYEKGMTIEHFEWLREFQKTYNAFVQQTDRELAALKNRVGELEP